METSLYGMEIGISCDRWRGIGVKGEGGERGIRVEIHVSVLVIEHLAFRPRPHALASLPCTPSNANLEQYILFVLQVVYSYYSQPRTNNQMFYPNTKKIVIARPTHTLARKL